MLFFLQFCLRLEVFTIFLQQTCGKFENISIRNDDISFNKMSLYNSKTNVKYVPIIPNFERSPQILKGQIFELSGYILMKFAKLVRYEISFVGVILLFFNL